MAAILAAVTPPPAGAAVAFRVLDGGPVNLDVDDLELAALVNGDPVDTRLDDDEVTIVVDVPPGLEGSIGVALAVSSVDLDLDLVGAVVLEATAHRYGATFAGVEALVPNITVDYSSTPNVGDVHRWLDELGARVAGRLGELDELEPGDLEVITERASGLVHLGAAAYVEDAAHPDRASTQGDARYGAVLWARFLEGLEELAVDVGELLAGAGVTPTVPARPAAASFPPPLFQRDRIQF